jgi:hypothetical protein
MRTALLLTLLLSLTACKKPAPTDAAPSSAPPPKAESKAPLPAAPAGNEPFAGTFQRTAELTMRNGRRVSNESSKGTASIAIGGGKVVFTQAYPSKTGTSHVTQYYNYSPSDIRPEGGGFDVTLRFDRMDSDTKNYNPDKNSPKLEARRAGSGWQIGLTTTDDKGVWGGVEFR